MGGELSQTQMQVLKRFRTIFGSVRQHFRDVEHSCGISGSQLWILQEVAAKPGIGVSELAERLSIHQSTASQLLEKLVKRGLIIKQRGIEDQRRVGLAVTDAALQLLQQAPGPAEGLLPEALQALPEPTLTQLDALLVLLIQELRSCDDKMADKPLADL